MDNLVDLKPVEAGRNTYTCPARQRRFQFIKLGIQDLGVCAKTKHKKRGAPGDKTNHLGSGLQQRFNPRFSGQIAAASLQNLCIYYLRDPLLASQNLPSLICTLKFLADFQSFFKKLPRLFNIPICMQGKAKVVIHGGVSSKLFQAVLKF